MTPAAEDRVFAAWNAFHLECDGARFRKLLARAELFRMVADLPGDVVDAGAFKGASTVEFAHLLDAWRPHSRDVVLSFDTFDATMPGHRADEAPAVERLMRDRDPDAFEVLSGALARIGIAERVRLLRGDIAATLPAYLDANPGCRISLLHCDLDAYAPTLATLRAAWPRLVPGGIAVFDEYAVEAWGEADAVDEFLAGLPERPRLRTLRISRTPTAYAVKP